MWSRVCAFSVLILLTPREAPAYGVLAHEAVIDAAWESSIAPLLRARFHPSNEALQKARAFAYGGSLIQDLGYYPFSSRTFGDLTHYVRSGDFVVNLLDEASDINEYAFALGALAHYVGDDDGHPLAVNPSVGLLYPKLRAKFGPNVTYEQSPSAHLKTEFGLDVMQIARGTYVPTQYHAFIGFEVSKPVLERAFLKTYGLELKDVFGDLDFAVGTFRFSVGKMIPQMTKVAWKMKGSEIQQAKPGMTPQKFMFGLSRQDYEREWGTKYDHPGFRSKLLAVIVRVIPKIGPFGSLAFKPPTPDAEALFSKSFVTTVTRYRTLVGQAGRHQLSLADHNLDIGLSVTPGRYKRADEVYETLLHRLTATQFQQMSPALRRDLLAFFADLPQTSTSRGQRKRLAKVKAEIDQLRTHAAN